MKPFKFDAKTIMETYILDECLKKKKRKQKGKELTKEEEKKILATSFLVANEFDLF